MGLPTFPLKPNPPTLKNFFQRTRGKTRLCLCSADQNQRYIGAIKPCERREGGVGVVPDARLPTSQTQWAPYLLTNILNRLFD